MAVVGYLRVSRIGNREGESFISPHEQRRAIEAWAKLHRKPVVEIVEDLDQPGTKRERPGLEKCLGMVRAGTVEGIVVAKLDRFGRSVPHLGQLLDTLSAQEASLWTVAEGIDTSGRAGRMMATILSAIAEFEVARIGETWYSARLNAVERGVWVRWQVPIGYSKGEDGRLTPSKDAPAIRELFRRRAGNESWARLARWLTDETGQNISQQRVRSIIKARVYLGEISGDQGILNLAAHEPLVTLEEWDAANRVQGTRPKRSWRTIRPLTGIVRCAGCRYALKPSLRGDGSIDYVCKSKSKVSGRNSCETPVSIASARLDTLVLERFWDFAEEARLRRTDPSEKLAIALDDLNRAEQRRDAAVSDRLSEILGPNSEAHLKVIAEAEADVRAAQAVVDDLTSREVDLPDIDLREAWPDLAIEQQRQLLASTIDSVFIRRSDKPGPNPDISGRVHICWRGTGPDVPRSGVPWVVRPYDFPAPLGVPLAHDGDEG